MHYPPPIAGLVCGYGAVQPTDPPRARTYVRAHAQWEGRGDGKWVVGDGEMGNARGGEGMGIWVVRGEGGAEM